MNIAHSSGIDFEAIVVVVQNACVTEVSHCHYKRLRPLWDKGLAHDYGLAGRPAGSQNKCVPEFPGDLQQRRMNLAALLGCFPVGLSLPRVAPQKRLRPANQIRQQSA
jgi:hypothetical protein